LKNVVLISCTSKKKSYRCMAKELYYASELFRASYSWAKRKGCEVYILSAKYGLLEETDIIEPYNETLLDKTPKEIAEWRNTVMATLKEKFDVANTKFVILAGKKYCEPITPYLVHYELPLNGMRIGERISYLNCYTDENNDLCYSLHRQFNDMKRYDYSMIDEIPFANGIYIMFEKGEAYKGFDRIVRVGTHTSDNRLKRRLKDHYLKENKDGSIFRKNIGKAILNKNNHPYLQVWSLDTNKTADKYDEEFQEKIEKQVSAYLKDNITFTCFQVDTKEDRLRLEEGIIALLNSTPNFEASTNWLGRFSPIDDISQSGLWLREGLNGKPITVSEYEKIVALSGETKLIEKPPKRIEQSPPKTIGVSDIVLYLKDKFEQVKKNGMKEIIIRSGEIHSELGLKDRMPTVCNAMYKLQTPKDEVLEKPNKGYGARLVIKYYFN